MRNLICIKLLATFSFNILFVPLAQCGVKQKFYRQKNRKSRIHKNDKHHLKNRKGLRTNNRKKIKAQEKKRKIDSASITKKIGNSKSLLILSLLPCFVSTRVITSCTHKMDIVRRYQGIYWYKKCDARHISPDGFLIKKYTILTDPDYCPTNGLKLPDYVMNCKNGTEICSMVNNCKKCYKTIPPNGTWQDIDFKTCTAEKKPTVECTFGNVTACFEKEIATLKYPLIITSATLAAALLAIIALQAQVCYLIRKKRKKEPIKVTSVKKIASKKKSKRKKKRKKYKVTFKVGKDAK